MRLSFFPAKIFITFWIEMLAETFQSPPKSRSSVGLSLARCTTDWRADL